MPNNIQSHPKLVGRFHPDYPNDLEVLIHDGGPRLSTKAPELVWVTVLSEEDSIFRGRVLNTPHNLTSVTQNSEITFIVPNGSPHPVMVTPKYLSERSSWLIHPCDKCGMSEIFDAPSDFMKAVFPNTPEDAVLEGFTSKCPICGGFLALEHLPISSKAKTKQWWQFWR